MMLRPRLGLVPLSRQKEWVPSVLIILGVSMDNLRAFIEWLLYMQNSGLTLH
jgi:hypothetical protein